MRSLKLLLAAVGSVAVLGASAAPGDIEDVKYVPSGVAEVSRLQIQDGYAYLKP